MERYRWEFYGHLLLSLHISLLHISFISSSWTLSTLSGKRCLHLFEDGSGRKENQILLLYNSNACLPEPDVFSPFLTPALPTVYIIICPDICPVKDDKELGAGGVSLPVSGSMTPFSAQGLVRAGASYTQALLHRNPIYVGPKALVLCCHVDNLITEKYNLIKRNHGFLKIFGKCSHKGLYP